MKKQDPELRSGEESRSDADEARRRILARRASFVAAALAGVSTACGKEPNQPPQPCLSMPLIVEDAGPEPCLSPVPPEQVPGDAGAPVDAGSVPPGEVEAVASDAAAPVPCLRVVAPPGGPRPQVCLSVAPPSTADGGKPTPPPRPCLKIAPPRSQ